MITYAEHRYLEPPDPGPDGCTCGHSIDVHEDCPCPHGCDETPCGYRGCDCDGFREYTAEDARWDAADEAYAMAKEGL